MVLSQKSGISVSDSKILLNTYYAEIVHVLPIAKKNPARKVWVSNPGFASRVPSRIFGFVYLESVL